MSKPTVPPDVAGFRARLDAYNLAAAKWLGFNVEQICAFDVNNDDAFAVSVSWEAIAPQEPRGHTIPGYRSDSESVVFTGDTSLDGRDSEAFVAAVGRKPQMFTAVDRERLGASLHERFRASLQS